MRLAAVLAAVAAGATTGRLWPCCHPISLPWAAAVGTPLTALVVAAWLLRPRWAS